MSLNDLGLAGRYVGELSGVGNSLARGRRTDLEPLWDVLLAPRRLCANGHGGAWALEARIAAAACAAASALLLIIAFRNSWTITPAIAGRART